MNQVVRYAIAKVRQTLNAAIANHGILSANDTVLQSAEQLVDMVEAGELDSVEVMFSDTGNKAACLLVDLIRGDKSRATLSAVNRLAKPVNVGGRLVV